MTDDNWAPDECTLPTAQRPLRVAEFGALFDTALRGVERGDDATLRLTLIESSWDEVERLTAAETDCCSFFRFSLSRRDDRLVGLTVTVPANQSAVLDGLTRQAETALAR